MQINKNENENQNKTLFIVAVKLRTQAPRIWTECFNHMATLACSLGAQVQLFKPLFNAIHLLSFSPLSPTSPTLSPPHFHSQQLKPLHPPRTYNSQELPRGVWCLYKGQFTILQKCKTQASLPFSILSHFLFPKFWSVGWRKEHSDWRQAFQVIYFAFS